MLTAGRCDGRLKRGACIRCGDEGRLAFTHAITNAAICAV